MSLGSRAHLWLQGSSDRNPDSLPHPCFISKFKCWIMFTVNPGRFHLWEAISSPCTSVLSKELHFIASLLFIHGSKGACVLINE